MGWGPKAPDMTASNTAAASEAASAAAQTAIAQDEWNTTKSYLPQQMAQAQQANDIAKQSADMQAQNATFYQGIAQHQADRAALSEPAQDAMYKTAAQYADGTVANTMAGQANADVQQAFTNSSGAMERNAARMGINTGSGAFAAGMTDNVRNEALAGAGAQTQARIDARNKAEIMVANAAGAGTGNMSAALASGGLSGTLSTGATNNAQSGLVGTNAAQQTFNQGAGVANSGYANSGSMYGQAANQLDLNAIQSAKTPGFDALMGLATGGMQMAGSMAKLSDRRLKTDIRRVGTLDDGTAVYVYRYKTGGPMQMGVMADEIELTRPGAVYKKHIANEFDAVDYGAI